MEIYKSNSFFTHDQWTDKNTNLQRCLTYIGNVLQLKLSFLMTLATP